jgi:hypothetical protein
MEVEREINVESIIWAGMMAQIHIWLDAFLHQPSAFDLHCPTKFFLFPPYFCTYLILCLLWSLFVRGLYLLYSHLDCCHRCRGELIESLSPNEIH